MHRTAVWQYSSNSNIKNCPQFYLAFLVESIWFFFWWCPLLSVDCFYKLCLSGTPTENTQAVWDLGNSLPGVMVLTWNVSVPWEDMPEVFRCSVWKVRCHLNNSDITSYWTDSFHVMYLLLAIALFVTNLNLSRLFRRPLWGGGRGVYKHIYSFRKYTF